MIISKEWANNGITACGEILEQQLRSLWKIFGPKREDNRSWRKLHNDEIHSLYSSPDIVRVIKSRRMR
jgi:hypothetical protein